MSDTWNEDTEDTDGDRLVETPDSLRDEDSETPGGDRGAGAEDRPPRAAEWRRPPARGGPAGRSAGRRTPRPSRASRWTSDWPRRSPTATGTTRSTTSSRTPRTSS